MLTASPGLMVWTLITFGIAVFVLWRYAFGPVQKIIDQRRANIQESMDAAEETRAEAERLLDEYKQTLAEVREEAEAILERSRSAGEVAKAEILAESRAHAERIVAKAHEQVERETRAALQDLKTEVVELTLLATEKVAASGLSEAAQRRLIDEALAELDFDRLSAESNG
jgi:F-type H+-transporting ATPase subunit b